MTQPVRRRVLVVTTDPLADTMPGPAIRAWHLATVLGSSYDTVLGSTVAATRTHPDVEVTGLTRPAARRRWEAWAEVLVVPAGVLHEWPELASSEKVIAVDLYDPYHLENLEPGEGPTSVTARTARVAAMTDAINDHLRRGDFFMCATERQRDFWLGSLASLGRINPLTYDDDPTLSSLVAVVPFGLAAEPPHRQGPGLRQAVEGIGPDDRVIVWAGGVYNWFDPGSLIRAMPGVAAAVPNARLVFLGMQHPNPAIPAMRAATEARQIADELGLTGRVVFFNEGWVPYDRRADYLLDAAVGVSTHLDHIETRYSFRTRVLDYIWAGLPMVLTAGDVLADLAADEGLGWKVPPGDVAAIEQALVAALESPAHGSSRFEAVRESLRWDRVAAPLVGFCAQPRRAPDRGVPARPSSPESDGAAGYTPPVQTLRAKLRATLERLVIRVAQQTADRVVQPVLARTEELERILGDQGDAADEVAETLGRAVTRLSAEVTSLATEVARLRERLDGANPLTSAP